MYEFHFKNTTLITYKIVIKRVLKKVRVKKNPPRDGRFFLFFNKFVSLKNEMSGKIGYYFVFIVCFTAWCCKYLPGKSKKGETMKFFFIIS